MKTGTMIRDTRKGLHINQTALSAQTGIAQSTISAIETGRQMPSDSHVVLLSRALQLDVGEVFATIAEDKADAARAQMADDGGGNE